MTFASSVSAETVSGKTALSCFSETRQPGIPELAMRTGDNPQCAVDPVVQPFHSYSGEIFNRFAWHNRSQPRLHFSASPRRSRGCSLSCEQPLISQRVIYAQTFCLIIAS
ncbi:hypothetical protein KC325_g12 [Hortaea werneckii]|nr:hypothetical protein KC325_g12 [Hortaea werneckii]